MIEQRQEAGAREFAQLFAPLGIKMEARLLEFHASEAQQDARAHGPGRIVVVEDEELVAGHEEALSSFGSRRLRARSTLCAHRDSCASTRAPRLCLALVVEVARIQIQVSLYQRNGHF